MERFQPKLNYLKIEATRLSTPSEAAPPSAKPEKSAQQKQLHAKLEEAANNWEKKHWTVSQDDIHFAVHMLDTHQLGLKKI